MNVKFLGTGTSQGVPVIACQCKICKSAHPRDKRLRTSLMIEKGGKRYVIDAGPDFRQQMLREDVQELDAIFITHEHKDHIGGIDDVRAFNFKSRKAIDIFCDKRVESALRREFPYSFETNGYPGAPRMNIHIIHDRPFIINDTEIIPIKAFHKDLAIYGFRIDDFTYLSDVNAIPQESMSILSGTRYLVINALRKEKHPSHFNLQEALDLINIVKPTRAYLTHIGHEMGLHHEVSLELPANVELAYDGLEVII